MDLIKSFIEGELPADRFIEYLKTDNKLRETVSELLPKEIARDSKNPYWKTNSYKLYASENFDTLKVINKLCSFNNSFGDNYDLHHELLSVYKLTHVYL